MQFINYTIARADTGAVLPYARVTVTLGGVTATLFNAGGTTIANPMTADINGSIGFAAANGVYVLNAVSADSAYSVPAITVQIFDLQAVANALAAGTLAGMVAKTKATQALLYADLAAADGSLGLVYADTAAANNDIYVKIGATGAGSWSSPTGLFVTATADARAYALAAAASAASIAISIVAKTSDSTHLVEFVDPLRRILAYFNNAGQFVAKFIKATRFDLGDTRSLTDSTDTGLIASFVGAGRKVALSVRTDGVRTGRMVTGALETGTLNGQQIGTYATLFGGPITLDSTTREIAVSNGQSLSTGTNGATSTVLTTTQPYGNLMFNGGVRYAQSGSNVFSSLVPHIEAYNSSTQEGETILGGFQAMLMQFLNNMGLPPYRHSLRTIAIAPGQGATAIAAFQSGGGLFTRFQQGVAQAVSLSSGQVVKCRQHAWLQCESDLSSTTYVADLLTLAASVDSMVGAATGQTEKCITMCYQIDRAKPALWFTQAADSSPLVQIAAPIYWVPYAGFVGANYDNVHRSPTGYKMLGACFAVAWFCNNVLKRPWRPLQLSRDAQNRQRCKVDGNDLIVYYDVPHGGALTFDDAINLGAQRQRGFYLFNSGGTEKPLTDVQVVGRNGVRLVGASAANGDILRVGFTDPTASADPTAAVNLRDQQGDVLKFDDLGRVPIHNWALIETHTFTTAELT